ncbi:hypothetical protein CLAFUW4_09671 [Fulvia fulva]|uniref:Uncharacterized protein n=1 Tax=Passalora fulva TaxID=5499 RepID=A0A9Q8PFG0_PASFU|nr:uncharacterized protein CLAFUR5_09765 [Fulvia fulva]KAK4613661.1 hypothetical protein CLAFUR4_09676 [Fulvia fulva]KAK4615011.1 hypothetical protein CLAFUR0_09667 [Fulvia fulva]UJO21614.1 hypothetical protein CLAFUR5_09765 [Fulvia fulva]WPV20055.1 hypothetical protein CLAFUW4_09671 [Fulvia fulva]WPV35071.1 hypothetical protein CLAFUW7_09672 [Fulvia fulva]
MPRNMLFNLPSEIRNQIYHYLVVEHDPIDLLRLTWRKDMTGYGISMIPEPALARTCKALRVEVLSLYLSDKTFNVGIGAHVLSMNETTHALSRWFSRLGTNARFLRHVELDVNCEILGPKNAAYSLRDFWEILHLSIRTSRHDLEIELKGDPLVGELCVCEAKRQAGLIRTSKNARAFDVLTAASQLYLTTTEYGECDQCQRPRLTEARKVNGSIYISDIE